MKKDKSKIHPILYSVSIQVLATLVKDTLEKLFEQI